MMRMLRVTVRVENQDEALRFYTDKLGFEKRADMPMGPKQRWITVSPKDDHGVEMVLQPSDWFDGEERRQHAALVGKDPTLVFQVDDCRATYDKLHQQGVKFSLPPTDRGYGIEADGQDLYGNTLVFLQLPGGH
ncbi:MAG TPA: VOC family protein [Aggregatilineales bacterium]|nr:VOC family protein [Aggregatilineales bacterium]